MIVVVNLFFIFIFFVCFVLTAKYAEKAQRAQNQLLIINWLMSVYGHCRDFACNVFEYTDTGRMSLYGCIAYAPFKHLQHNNTRPLPLNLTVFALTQKSKQKMSRLRPLISKNRRDKGGNRQNSFRRKTPKLKQRRFFSAFLTGFSAHRSMAVLQAVYRYLCFEYCISQNTRGHCGYSPH